MQGKNITIFTTLAIVLAIVFVLQLVFGSVNIPFVEILNILSGNSTNETWSNIVIEARLPGALAALLAGAGLSVSGLQMQTMFRNPVAGPYVLGISAGASLGVAVLIMASTALGISSEVRLMSSWSIIIAAALGAVLIFLVNFAISFRLNDVVAILIIGLMIGGGISALIEILQSITSNEALKQYVLWTFGSFRYTNLSQIGYLAGVTVIGLVFSYALSKPLNLLLLGDTYATTSGVNVQRAKVLVVLCTSILAGSITAFCGPIGFVGLAVPHIARSLFNSADHRILTPACALMGAIICCLCNIVSSTPGTDYVLPINAITSLLGAPIVIWIILKQRRL